MFTNAYLSKIIKLEADVIDIPMENVTTPTFNHNSLNISHNKSDGLYQNSTQPEISFSIDHSLVSSVHQLDRNQTNPQLFHLQDKNVQNNTQIQEVEQEADNSEFMQLKQQMCKIQQIAVRQVNKLKEQLQEKDNQIGQLLQVIQLMKQKQQTGKDQLNGKKIKEVQTQTQMDLRDEQVRSLKQALIRHIRLNKQLTKKMFMTKSAGIPQLPTEIM